MLERTPLFGPIQTAANIPRGKARTGQSSKFLKTTSYSAETDSRKKRTRIEEMNVGEGNFVDVILLLAPGLEPQLIGRRRLARKLEGRRLKEEKRKKEKAIEEGILMKTREMIECQYRQHCVINAMMALDGVAD